ncbi:MAG: ribosome silencing factor [Bdellovibrio sp.]|nr:ribosome silencing factor [Bdellovibrio sp.]
MGEKKLKSVPDQKKVLLFAQAALEKKAENVKVLDVSEMSSFTDFFLICSGSSNRQVQAIADSIRTQAKGAGLPVVSVEGYSDGRWVLIDLGNVVVHIFQDVLREYYALETLWAGAPRIQIPIEYYETKVKH